MKKRKVVLWFSNKMEEQLKANDHKTGWTNEDIYWLQAELDRHKCELPNLIDRSVPSKNIIKKCTNIANFAMMIADIYGNQIGDR